jgi:hypothetical protein
MRDGRARILVFAVLLAIALAPAPSRAAEGTTETLVFVRHGEKPRLGLGQLDCQGLNRALALPAVLTRQFGRPAFILAPDPAVMKKDAGVAYDYVRPLATIEPTAIALGMPIDASLGVDALDALRHRLEAPDMAGAVVFVAWEHSDIVKVARALMVDAGGDPAVVPAWNWQDFDSIYVLRIARAGGITRAAFAHGHEGLDGQPTTCPGAAMR